MVIQGKIFTAPGTLVSLFTMYLYYICSYFKIMHDYNTVEPLYLW